MAKHQGIFTYLRNKVLGAFLPVKDEMGYDVDRVYSDLTSRSFVTKGMVGQLIPTGGQVIAPITGGVTANPITVAYTDMVNPTLIFRNSDGSNYSGAANNVDDGSSIVLTGDDDGSGKFADSFVMIIKP